MAESLDKSNDSDSDQKIDKQTIITFKILSSQLISYTHPHFKASANLTDCDRHPNLIIIGQAKCGTTSLYSYLRKHPQILPSLKKEIHFWNNNYQRGLDWYLAHFPPINSEQNIITGEASTTYFKDPQIAPRIKELFPDIKNPGFIT